MSKKRILAYIIIPMMFIATLTTGRLLWLEQFKPTAQPTIEQGLLDLREWDFTTSSTFTLDGEWHFLPHSLTTSVQDFKQDDVALFNIPGNWSKALNPLDESPFGYGSYHLRILVNPEHEQAFAARVSSIRSSSAFYANGQLIGQSGQVDVSGTSEDDFNVPYTTSSIWANDNGVIDLVIQTANRTDPRSAGIIRSMTFGDETTLMNQTELSTFLQIAASAFFFVFAIFAVVLYTVGWKDRRLLYFSLVLWILMFINLSGGDDKLFVKYLKIPYDISYKLSFSCFVLAGIALVQSIRSKSIQHMKKLANIHAIIGLLAIILCTLLPVEKLTYASLFSVSYLILSMAFAALIFFMGRKHVNGGILMSLSTIAFAHQFIWYGYSLNSGIKVMYYPFDLGIGLVLLAAVWFKSYYQTYRNTQLYAEKLQSADELRDEFLANTSHELRNPLHGILNISEAVLKRESANLQAESHKDLQTVQSVGRRMTIMLNDLLDFTRIRNQKPKMTLTAVSLSKIIEHSIDLIRFMVNGKNIQFVNKVQHDFPLIYADEYKVQQIIFNLLHNAVKYTEKGEITVSATVMNEFAHISVHDTGQGMTDKTSKYIFDPYYQEHSNEGGFGIGLSLTKQLVELHGGTIHVESQLHEETSFIFTIPIAEEQQAQPIQDMYQDLYPQTEETDLLSTGSTEDTITPPKPASRDEKKRILVVDDDPVNLQVVTSILDDKRFDIRTVLSPTEALQKLSHSDWDLLITDVMMPGMTGYELTKKMRRRFSLTELPIILLTARAQETEIEYGFLIGANDYVTKPVSTGELTSRVHTLLDMKTAAEEQLQMEAAWLQAQIQPHFLFNTLNTILALSELDIERMQKLLEVFNQLLRQKFQFHRSNELWSIEEEIDFVKSYVYIEQERFAERIRINWDVDDDLPFKIPSLSIQPLVENAIRHGILKKEEGGTVTIRAKSYDNHAVIEVIDDGVGMTDETVRLLFSKEEPKRTSVGLTNVNARLKKLYGTPLSIDSKPGKGTKISFHVYDLD